MWVCVLCVCCACVCVCVEVRGENARDKGKKMQRLSERVDDTKGRARKKRRGENVSAKGESKRGKSEKQRARERRPKGRRERDKERERGESAKEVLPLWHSGQENTDLRARVRRLMGA